MNSSNRRRLVAKVLVLFGALLLVLGSRNAQAEVRREGTWPSGEKAVTLSVAGQSRSQALRALADKAGWSVVAELPASAPVELHVRDQDPNKVLDLLFADGRWVARRDGALISLAPDRVEPAAAPATPPVPPGEPSAAPAASATTSPSATPAAGPASPADVDEVKERGEDRVVTGGDATIGREELVHDVVVMGGEADVSGTVTGDLSVMGGEATIRSGAHVHGDASVLGGELTIEDGARVDGDVGVLGGELTRGPDARIGGKVSSKGGSVRIKLGDGHEEPEGEGGWTFRGMLHDAGAATTRMAVLFVFGAILLGLATRRMETLEAEVAARPMRSFGLGIVGLLAGAVSLIALCITVIGIPIALVAVILAVFAGFAGVCAVLTAVGAALVRHRSTNPYVHLAVGCALFLVTGAIPFVGPLVTMVVMFVGLGIVVATRAAGFVPQRKRGDRGDGPYRTPAAA